MRTPFFVASGNTERSAPPRSRSRLRAVVAASAVVAVVLASPAAVTLTPSTAGATGQALSNSVPAPSASEASPMCTTVEPASVLGPASTTVPTDPVTNVVTPPGGVGSLTATATDLYVVNSGDPATLYEYTLAGAAVTSFALPTGFDSAGEISQPVVDSSGDIYLSSYYGQKVDKFSSSGTLLWSVDPSGGNPTNLFMAGSGAGAQLVVSLVQGSSSVVLNEATGATGATFPFFSPVGGYVTTEASGNLLASDDGYVETVSAAGTVLSTFGSSGTAGTGSHTGGPYQFYYTGQADQGSDGTIYTADPLGTVEATSPTGMLEGKTTLGGAISFGTWGMQLEGGAFYFASGPPFDGGGDAISTFSLTTLQTYLGAPAPATDALGWGAGLSTPAAGEYFAPGVAPTVDANFDPWWVSVASQLSLSFSFENQTSMNAETAPAPTTIALPSTAAALASVPLTVPAQDTLPGPYEVQATLENDSTSPPTVLGTTCLPYTVGAGSDSLNLASLPAGSDGGGPPDTRGVPLSEELGLDGLRAQDDADWSALLPSCNFSAPTAATCGSSAMDVAAAPLTPYQAAYEAAADHVTYWYQVSGGESTDMALVNAGLWGQDIQALVAHYATVPSGCGACDPVTMWEPWNESNNTGWSSGATYTTSVLIPFYDAVKAVLPGTGSTVLGGTTLGPDVSWWNQLAAAGGLSYMDVAAMHPYTGSNDSWEEDGMIAQIQQLQAVLGAKPLWFTEVGWWSDGDFNYLEQADIVARAEIWMKVLHIPVWGYFFTEGNWGNDGVSFSLVQVGANGDDYVKPAALASMESAQQLGGRDFTMQPATGIPQTYQADFGTTATGTTDLAAVWSDGLNTTGAVTLTGTGTAAPVTVTDQYGNATTSTAALGTTYSLPISDQVTYVTYPAADTLTVSAPESYTTNVALSSAGATATATSQNVGNGNYADDAIVGLTTGYGQGWSSASGDVAPALTISWPTATTVNRVLVDTQSVGSTATGIRNYTVALDEGGTWTTVATEVGQFRDHEQLFALTPASATGVRISVSEVDFGGYYGGGIPPWWSSTTPAQAFIHTVQVYAGTSSPAQVAGTGLVPLTTGYTAPATPEPPATPTGLVATAGNGQVALTWTAVSGATTYTVFENGTSVGSVASPSDTVTGLTDGTSYSFTVSASNGGGTSVASTAASATPEPAPPATPTGLVATAGNGQVALTWTAVSGATTYTVFENGTSVGSVTSPSDTVTGLTDGTSYSFTVSASNGGGTSVASTAAFATPEPPAPATPTGLVATAGNGQVALTWTAVSGATTYTVFENGTSVASVTSPSDTVTGLTNGTSYSFTVSASNGGGTSVASTAASATPEPAPPATPTGLVATAGNGQVALTWTAVPGATTYTVFENGTSVASVTSPSDTVTGLTNGTSYSFTVAASNGGGTSTQSTAASATPEPQAPATPTGLVATAGNGQVALTWTAVPGATTYTVFENGTSMASVTSPADTVTGLTDGTSYSFTVSASNGGGTSVASTAASATPEPAPPATPTGLVATAGNGQVALTWTAVSGATTYLVYENGTTLASVTSPADTVTGLTDGTSYSFTVSASNGGGTSVASTAASATPEPAPPATPTGLVATAGNGQVALTWTAVPGATTYTVFENGTSIASVTSPADTVTGLTDGTSYSFTVAASNGGGTSVASTAASATPEPAPPATPTGLVATAGNGQVALTWTAVPGATTYTVFENGTSMASVTSPADTVTGLTDGTSYSFTVAASNGGGTSSQSTAASATPEPQAPATPTGLVATVGNGQVALTWTAVPGATTYTVFENGTSMASVTSPADTVTGLTDGTSYSFTVAASDGGGTSTQSASVLAAPVDPVPSVPTDVTATSVTDDGATVTWASSSGATAYTVLANGTDMQTSVSAAAQLTGLNPGTPYSLAVAASDPGGTSAPSTAAPIVTTPSVPTLAVKEGVVTLTFTGDTGAHGPSWSVLDNGSPMGGATFSSSGSTVKATLRGLAQGTVYRFSIQGTIGGAVSPPTATVTYVTRAVPMVTTDGTVQTLAWDGTTAGVAWRVEGCSSIRIFCAGHKVVSTGPIVQSGTTLTTTVVGCSPCRHYRYRVIGTDVVTLVSSEAGPLVEAGLG